MTRVEAAMQVAIADGFRWLGEDTARRMLDAADAALRDEDRVGRVERVASALAIADSYDPNSVELHEWPEICVEYRRMAEAALAAAYDDEEGRP